MSFRSTILLSACLINFSCFGAANASELNHDARQKLSDGPVNFKVEEHKAEQKLVFKLGLPLSSPPAFVQNASKAVQNTFHQWGAAVEKACHNLDHYLRTNQDAAKTLPFAPKSATNAAADGQRAGNGRGKAIAER